MHSIASDGVLAPLDIYEQACESGLSCISVTDHDTLSGARELASLVRRGVQTIPGVEISTQTDGRDIHLLGYFVDLDNETLESHFVSNRATREKRACAMADLMAEDGYPVSGEAMRSSGNTVNRTLIARTLVEAGFASDIDDAYDRLIGRGCKYYIENVYLSTADAIGLVKQAGGFAFMAHPAQYHVVDLIEPLVAEGLDGIEAFHTMHSPSEAEHLVELAESLDIGISGGSDWHGDSTHGSSLGGSGLDDARFEAFLHTCQRSIDDI